MLICRGKTRIVRFGTDSFRENPCPSHSYYNDETSRRAGKNLECGDLSPLLPLWRLVAKAGPRPAARESWTPFRIGRRQVACRKRGQVRALQSGCGSAALGLFVSIRGYLGFSFPRGRGSRSALRLRERHALPSPSPPWGRRPG